MVKIYLIAMIGMVEGDDCMVIAFFFSDSTSFVWSRAGSQVLDGFAGLEEEGTLAG